MRCKVIYIFLFIILCSCKQRQTSNFEYIDYSGHNDRSGSFSFKIFKDGRAYINHYKGSIYTSMLDNIYIDSINVSTQKILDLKFDSILFGGDNCTSCLSFCLIIKTMKDKNKIFYLGQDFDTDKLKILQRYIQNIAYILDKSSKSLASNDSITFESWTKDILQPGPNIFKKYDCKNK